MEGGEGGASGLNVGCDFCCTVLEDRRVQSEVLVVHMSSIGMMPYERKRTGVSNAMHAIMFGHRGAVVSGSVRTNSMRASAASRPPMLDSSVLRECTGNLGQHNALPVST